MKSVLLFKQTQKLVVIGERVFRTQEYFKTGPICIEAIRNLFEIMNYFLANFSIKLLKFKIYEMVYIAILYSIVEIICKRHS